MVTIITPGTLPEERSLRGVCPRCQCVFDFFPKEARVESRQGEPDFLRIDCPTCRMGLAVSPHAFSERQPQKQRSLNSNFHPDWN